MSEFLDNLIVNLGWALLRFIWQGALLGSLCAIMLLAARKRSAQLRYLIAGISLGACALLPLLDVWQNWHAARSSPSPDGVNAIAAMAGLQIDEGWFGFIGSHMRSIVMAWAVCCTMLALRLGAGLLWISHTFAAGYGDARLQATLDRLGTRLNLTRTVRLRVVSALSSPVAAGVWRATIAVPATLISGMPADLLEALLAHELAHVRRHDYLINLLQNLIETLLFYHPAVWWISRRIRIERELIADALAAQAIGEPRRLALALSELEALQFSNHNLAQAANGGMLMQRIKKLLNPEAQAMNWKAAIPALGLALACLAGYVQAAGSAPAIQDSEEPHFADLMACRPEYPQDLREKNVTGTVKMTFTIAADGKVSRAVVSKSSGNTKLDNYTRDTLSKCAFTPAVHNGKPVQADMDAVYVWKLED